MTDVHCNHNVQFPHYYWAGLCDLIWLLSEKVKIISVQQLLLHDRCLSPPAVWGDPKVSYRYNPTLNLMHRLNKKLSQGRQSPTPEAVGLRHCIPRVIPSPLPLNPCLPPPFMHFAAVRKPLVAMFWYVSHQRCYKKLSCRWQTARRICVNAMASTAECMQK